MSKDLKSTMQEKPKELDPVNEARKAAEAAKTRYGLTEEQTSHLQNGLTGFAQSKIELSDALIKGQVKNVAPLNFEITQIKEAMAGAISAATNVVTTSLSYLSPPATSISQPQSGIAGPK